MFYYWTTRDAFPFPHCRTLSSSHSLCCLLVLCYRGLPLPIPGDGSGSQLVALSHVEDVVNMLVSAIGSGKADKQTYNCGTDKFVSYRSVCEAVARAMGLPVSSINITGYDPKKLNKVGRKGNWSS